MTKNSKLPERILANQVLSQVLNQGLSLTEALNEINMIDTNIAFIKELCYGTLRYYERLMFFLDQLLQKPLKEKDQGLKPWLLMGLYQLAYMRIPEHAAVNEMVKLTPQVAHEGVKNLVNAILRNYLRQRAALEKQISDHPNALFCLPKWLLQRLQANWPMSFQPITEAFLRQAPLTLRVNTRKIQRDAYLTLLKEQGIGAKVLDFAPQAIVLEKAVTVESLPGFQEGLFSVQDAGAQLAAPLLDLEEGMLVLDACAAPGGKSTHICELANVNLVALDVSAKRLTRVQENLTRLGFTAEIIANDIKQFAKNYTGPLFDRILLDVPCSAVGVISRHPDIKRHRTAKDIHQLSQEQAEILLAVWSLLKPSGILLYSTCSILKQENELQMANFLQQTTNAEEIAINLAVGRKVQAGWQLLPSPEALHDGFYYSKIKKTN